MGGKRTRFRTTTKQHIPFRAKPQKTRTSHLHLAATTTTTTSTTHLHLHLPLHIQFLSPFFFPFSFPSLYNCFFTWKRRTFPTVEGSFPISHFLALGFGHGHFSHASPTKEQGQTWMGLARPNVQSSLVRVSFLLP